MLRMANDLTILAGVPGRTQYPDSCAACRTHSVSPAHRSKATSLDAYIVTHLLYRKSGAPPMKFCNLTAALNPSTTFLYMETTSYYPLVT
jgi:hypothetical protein